MSFLGLHTNLRCPPKWQENNCEEKSPDDRRYPGVNVFLHLMQKFKMAVQICGKTVFGKNRQMTFRLPRRSKFVKISQSLTPSMKNVFLHCTRKFKMAAKNGGKTIFGENGQITLQIPRGSKISPKSLYLALFLI